MPEEKNQSSSSTSGKGISRRRALAVIGGAAAVAAVGGGAYWLANQGPAPSTTPGMTETVTATATATGMPAKKGVIGCEVDTWANEYYYWYDYGVADVARTFGLDHRVLSAEWDVATEINEIKAYIAAGVPMVVPEHIDDSSAYQVEKLCQANKTYYATTWNFGWIAPWDIGDYFVEYNIPDCFQNARDIANVVCMAMDQKGKLAYVEGQKGESTSEQRNKSFTDTVAKYPNIELIRGATGFWETPKAEKSMEDLLTTNPKVDGLLGANDAILLGMKAAAEAHGLKNLPSGGIDGIKTACQLIQQGQMTATIACFPAYQAGLDAVYTYDAWMGWKYKNEERFLNTICGILSKDDVAKIYPDHEEPWLSADDYYSNNWGDKLLARGGTTPWDWRKMSRYTANQEGFEVDMTGGFIGGTKPLDPAAFIKLLTDLMGASAKPK